MSDRCPVTRIPVLVCCVVWVTASVVGCTTYVNIPPQPGDMASHDPNADVVHDVVREAMRAILTQRPVRGDVALVMPDGTTLSHFIYHTADVRNLVDIAPDAPPPPDARGPIFEVRQVRIRGWSAGVDILVRADRQELHTAAEVVTVDMSWHALDGWVADRTRFWNRQLYPFAGRNDRVRVVSQPQGP